MIFDSDVKQLRIIGCGGHGRSVAGIAMQINPSVELSFFDDNAEPGERIISGRYGVYLLKDFILEDNVPFIVAIGDNIIRDDAFGRYKSDRCISVISDHSCISSYAEIGIGTFVGNLTHIGPEARIGDNCIINNGAVVEHECVIGSSSHISVGAKVCGRTKIGQRVMVGAGATVIDKLKICDDVVIGAGAAVIDDITASGIYVGVPARRIK